MTKMTIHCIVYNDQTCRAGRCRETPKSGEGFPFVIGHDFGNEYFEDVKNLTFRSEVSENLSLDPR